MKKAAYGILALSVLLLASAAGAFLHVAPPANATPELATPAPTPAPNCDLERFYQTCFADGVDYSGFDYPVLMRLFLAAHGEHPDAQIISYSLGNPIRLDLTDNGTPLAYCWDIAPMLAEKQLVAGYYMETIEKC